MKPKYNKAEFDDFFERLIAGVDKVIAMNKAQQDGAVAENGNSGTGSPHGSRLVSPELLNENGAGFQLNRLALPPAGIPFMCEDAPPNVLLMAETVMLLIRAKLHLSISVFDCAAQLAADNAEHIKKLEAYIAVCGLQREYGLALQSINAMAQAQGEGSAQA